jgi:hypothetical protein
MKTVDFLVAAGQSLAEGELALASGEYTEAIMAFRAGIRDIGDQYLGERPILDSTPTRITRAAVEERKGNSSFAANLLRNALASRISLMQRKLAATPAGAPPEGTI